MAEALCGPSNSLQSFQKHSSVDRTLQQDRLAFNQPPSQAFRSFSPPGAGNVDAEFEAFQSGGFQDYHALQAPGSLAGPSNQQLPGWASDFQRLNLNAARSSPIPSSHFRHEAPLQRNSSGGWHEEFMRQNNRQSPLDRNMTPKNGAMAYQDQSRFQTLSGPGTLVGHFSSIAQQKLPQQQLDEVFDETAFERAFDTARLEILQAEHQEALDAIHKNAIDSSETQSTGHLNFTSIQRDQTIHQPRTGSDTIPDESSRQESSDQVDREADELARTAGQLLDNLKHDKSEKFQNSAFLALMRQLRDKEVRVEGDQMVDNTQPLHPGGQYYPEGGLKYPKHASVSDDMDHLAEGVQASSQQGYQRTTRRSWADLQKFLGSNTPLTALDRRTMYPVACLFRRDLEFHGLD